MAAVDALARAWDTPPTAAGWLGAVTHKNVGRRFVVTAFAFLLVGGVEALLLRLQLAGPLRDVLGPQAYNEVFTMHGTTMMFLFAVPMLEGLGTYLVPLMLGTRDMPFPRLNAFGYWCFLAGGLLLYSSFLVGAAPDGGWFAYVPLTGPEFSPGPNLDFWLLGVTLVEIAGIVFAVEMIALVLKQRAPGMALTRMPLFAWSLATTAFVMLFAFPPLILASILLELDRKAGTRFFDAAAGGDPVLWQHLFWFFGHPDVYILFLPAAGIVSMVVPTFVRRPIAGYTFLVAATLVTGMLSFGVWVHHMYAVGLPLVSMSFFAAASLLFAVPNGVQYFAWLATIWRGRTVVWSTPMLFVVGFLVLFLLGGVTGVMVAIVPLDWQVHDSFFVVAHFHYVLVGGVLFPFFAGLHFWWPKLFGRMPSERLGRWSFWLMFAGFNLAFFVQHVLGLLGMPRRIYTFLPGLGWEAWNLLSTIGAFVLALGVGVFAWNLAWSWRRGPVAPADPWGGSTLEWATPSPPESYNFRDIPSVSSRDPLWQPAPAHVERRAAAWTGPLREPEGERREVLGTSELDGEPEEVFDVPQTSLRPLAAALALVAFLLGVLVGSSWLAAAAAIAGAGVFVGWLWPSTGPRGLTFGSARPAARAAPRPVGWWGAALGLAALATFVGSLVATYLYLRAGADRWPPAGVEAPDPRPVLLAGALLVASSLAVVLGLAAIRRGTRHGLVAAFAGALALGAASLVVGGLHLAALDVDPTATAYGSLVYVLTLFAGAFVLVGVGALALAAARAWSAELTAEDHVTATVAAALAGFGAGSALVLLATVHAVPYVW